MLIGKAAQVFLLHDHPRPEPCDSTCSFPNTDGGNAGKFPQMPQLSLTSSACRLVMLAHDAGSAPTIAVFPAPTITVSKLVTTNTMHQSLLGRTAYGANRAGELNAVEYPVTRRAVGLDCQRKAANSPSASCGPPAATPGCPMHPKPARLYLSPLRMHNCWRVTAGESTILTSQSYCR